MTGNSNSSLADVLADIKKFRKEINQRLDELERQADAAKTIKQENAKNLKTTEITCDDVTKSLKIMYHAIEHFNTSKQADRLFMKVIDNITDQCHKMSEDVKKTTGNSNSSLADVLADIKKFRKEINQRLDDLERRAEDAAKAMQ
ncbi:uncharacterized protein LOC128553205 [Mercenaria mercenaria]|uniref:uncharacterized protein LOC128553205 n=1 Tax=Mercenaria mercenaria TaxID=6596 RepID=UPI00234E971F|nr:uncharacterized protein LOC128553205 [Mercenaria mercenaria]